MVKGIFPTITIPLVIEALASWNIVVSHEQLVRPNPEFVENVYCACLQLVCEITHDSIREPVQTLVTFIDDTNADLYTPAVVHNTIIYQLSRFAEAARVDDFSANDIYMPGRERTQYILSAFINFIRYTEVNCGPSASELRARSLAIIAQREQVYHELEIVRHDIEMLKAKMAEDEPICAQFREENTALAARMIATKEFQGNVVQTVEQLKAEKNELLRRKDALNGEMASVADSTSRTRSRIVQSPERIKRTIATMGITATEEKKIVGMQEAKARDLQAKIITLLNIEKDVRGCVEQLQTTEKELRSLEVSLKEIADQKDHLDGKKIERSEMQLRQERVEQQLSNAHEKIERVQRHAEDKKMSGQKTIDRLQREYDEMSVERRDNDKQVEEIRAEADELENKMAENLKQSESELNELLAEYWKLRHETDVYMETLANKLNMRVSGSKV